MCLSVENLLVRPGRLASRPPFVYDNLTAVTSLGNFDDKANKATRLLAVDTSFRLYEKSATANTETWSSSLGTMVTSRVSSISNFQGSAFICISDSNGLPAATYSFDGTNLSSTPFNSTIAARQITPFIERNFLIYPRVTVTPLLDGSFNPLYNWSNNTNFPQTNVTVAQVVTNTNHTVCRISPTSTVASNCSIFVKGGVSGVTGFSVPTSTTPVKYLWQGSFRSTHAVYDVPVTLEWVLTNGVTSPTAYVVGDIVTSGEFAYQCTVAGTTAGVVYTTTTGATQVDGTASFICLGTAILNAEETYVFSLETSQDFQPISVGCTIPIRTNTVFIYPRLKLYNSTTPALTILAAIEISSKDGLTDGDPAKKNYGQQFTAGDFFFPFINTESVSTAAVDINAVIWSEIRDLKTIRNANNYQPNEFLGYPTACTTASNRLIVFYRNGFLQFQGTSDPDLPIRRELFNEEIGCIGPLAHDRFKKTIYFIAENDIYSYSPGSDPESILGDGMREIVMGRSSKWVESQSTYKRPILRIDKSQQILWVYTQSRTLFSYDLRLKQWSTHYVTVSGAGVEVDDMCWNANTGNFYVAFGGHGLAVMNFSAAAANDTINAAGTQYPGNMAIVLRPITIWNGGARSDFSVKQIVFWYASTISQTSQTVTLYWGRDQGGSYVHSVSCTPTQVSAAPPTTLLNSTNYLPLRLQLMTDTAPSVTFNLARVGKLGESAWSLSPHAYCTYDLVREEEYYSNPTAGSVT